ncbi:odorant receptor 10 [Megachile rotundata]|uniref:odorant receptor 10 n=1 Tax=Megachile rotundata TaxID=143995 RepID=UPI003FCF5A74
MTKRRNMNNSLFLDLFEHIARMKTSNSKDIAYAMTPLKILSWCTGVWPLQIYNAFAFIRYIFSISMLLLMIAILNAEVYFDRSNAEANLDVFMITVCGILAVSKVTCFRVYSSKLILNFSSAVKDYSELNDEEKRTIMRRHAYMSRIACASLIGVSNFCAVIFTLLPVLLKNNAENNATEKVKYPFPSTHVVARLKLPDSLNAIIFFTEYLMLMITSVGNIGSDGFFSGIVFHLCGQAEILKMQFSRVVDEGRRTAENIHSLIKRHEYLLELSGMLNETISSVLIMQLLASCILIATCGFQFILALHEANIVMVIKTFFILSTWMIQLFAYSYVGNYLRYQMDDIGNSVYKCDWYRLPTNTSKGIIFVILKARQPVHLMAGKFFAVNLESFMSIVKTSISYLSVLRVMINV